MKSNGTSTARAATLVRIRENIAANYIDPVPSIRKLRIWLERAGIPKFKPNENAERGGGECFYSVPATEKFFRTRFGR